MITRTPARRAALALLLAALPCVSTWADSSFTEHDVKLVWPATHFSAYPKTDLRGTETSALADPVYESGWWYRLEGLDTREYPLPEPDQGSALYGLRWNDVHGKGFSVDLTLVLADGEGPSGGWSERVKVSNLSGQARTIKLFHYLDADVSGTAGADTAEALGTRHDYLKFTQGSDVVRYRAYQRQGGAVHYAVRPYGQNLRDKLNDALIDEFGDTGAPAAAADQTAGFEFVQALPASGAWIECAQVSVMSRMPRDYVRGDHRFRGGHPDIFLESPSGYRQFWTMHGYTRGPVDTATATGQRRVVAVDDFSGGYHDQLLERDQVTGELFLDGAAVLPTQALNWRVAGTGDFDHDGKADILWRNSVSQKLAVWYMSGNLRTSAKVPNPDQAVDGNWELVGVGRFDGGEDLDFLWFNKTSGNLVIWYMNAALQRNAGASTNPANFGQAGWAPVAIGDWLRGDGPAGFNDILWQGLPGGPEPLNLYVWAMDQSGSRRGERYMVPSHAPDPVVAPH